LHQASCGIWRDLSHLAARYFACSARSISAARHAGHRQLTAGRKRSAGSAGSVAHQQVGSPARAPQRNGVPQRAQISEPGASRSFVSGKSFIILSSICLNDDRMPAHLPENVGAGAAIRPAAMRQSCTIRRV